MYRVVADERRASRSGDSGRVASVWSSLRFLFLYYTGELDVSCDEKGTCGEAGDARTLLMA